MFKNLDAELSRKGLSKRDLSKMTGIEYKTILNNLTGRTSISFKNVCIIRKKVFPSLTIEYLFDEGDENHEFERGKESDTCIHRNA